MGGSGYGWWRLVHFRLWRLVVVRCSTLVEVYEY